MNHLKLVSKKPATAQALPTFLSMLEFLNLIVRFVQIMDFFSDRKDGNGNGQEGE